MIARLADYLRKPFLMAVIGRGIQFLSQLVMILLVPKALAPELYVQLNLVLPLALLGVSFIFGWLANATYRHVYELLDANRADVRQTVFVYYATASVVLLSIYFILSAHSDSIYSLIPLLLVAAGLKNGIVSILNASNNHRGFLLANICFALSLAVFISLCFINTKDDLERYLMVYAAIDIVIAVIAWTVIGVFRLRPAPRFDPRITANYMKYGAPMVANVVAGWIIALSDRYILTIWENVDSVAGYILGYQLAGSAINIPMSFLMTVVYPRILHIDKEQGEAAALEWTHSLLRTYVRLMLPILLFACCIVLPFMHYVYPNYEYSPLVVIIIILAHVVYALTHFYNKEFELNGNTMRITRAVGSGAILNIVLNFMLIPYIGTIGAALATLLACSITVFLVYRAGRFRPVSV